MTFLQFNGAITAPFASPEALRHRRILRRRAVSPAVASVMAGLAWGEGRRDHDALLASLVAARVDAASAGARA